jgi:hypothetical protein
MLSDVGKETPLANDPIGLIGTGLSPQMIYGVQIPSKPQARWTNQDGASGRQHCGARCRTSTALMAPLRHGAPGGRDAVVADRLSPRRPWPMASPLRMGSAQVASRKMAKDHHLRGAGRYHIRVTNPADRASPTSPTTVAKIGLRIGRLMDSVNHFGIAEYHKEEEHPGRLERAWAPMRGLRDDQDRATASGRS